MEQHQPILDYIEKRIKSLEESQYARNEAHIYINGGGILALIDLRKAILSGKL